MENRTIWLILVAFVVWLMATVAISYAAPVLVEKDAQIYEDFDKPKFLAAAQSLVRLHGYRCDSISAAIPYVFSSRDGLTLTCNHSKYSYDITDRGGRWEVEVQ